MTAPAPVRLGGMALGNGVLVHGPNAWACAIRTAAGELEVVARRKSHHASRVQNPILRGPARLAEAFALIPQVKRAVPEAELPLERPRVLLSMIGSAFLLQRLRRSTLRPLARELVSSALSPRSSRARSPRRRARVLPRCGAHLDR